MCQNPSEHLILQRPSEEIISKAAVSLIENNDLIDLIDSIRRMYDCMHMMNLVADSDHHNYRELEKFLEAAIGGPLALKRL